MPIRLKKRRMSVANLDRREFLKGCTFGAGVIIAGGGLDQAELPKFLSNDVRYCYPGRVENWPGVKVKFSVCKQCHGDCGLMCPQIIKSFTTLSNKINKLAFSIIQAWSVKVVH